MGKKSKKSNKAQEAFGKEVIPDNMDEYLAIALLLISEEAKGADSFWAPYLATLGPPETVCDWDEADLEALSDPDLAERAASRAPFCRFVRGGRSGCSQRRAAWPLCPAARSCRRARSS